LTRMTVFSKGNITDHGLWLRSQTLGGDDQIEALLKAVKAYDRSDGVKYVSYGHAKSMGPGVSVWIGGN